MSSEIQKPQENSKPENIKKGFGINLIPTLTKEEEVLVTTKSQVNVGAAIALFILIFLTLVIVGFNIFAKTDLNRNKERLFQKETELGQRQDLLSSNSEILRRINLYKKIEQTTYSTRDAIVYLQEKSKGYAQLEEYKVINGENFEISGFSDNLTNVSKFWYILGNDKYIQSVNLKNVVKGATQSRFVFEGVLKLEEFKKDLQQLPTNNE